MNEAAKMLRAARRDATDMRMRNEELKEAAARIVVWIGSPPRAIGEKEQRDRDLLVLCKLLGMPPRSWRS
jgi:hypothetical protein